MVAIIKHYTHCAIYQVLLINNNNVAGVFNTTKCEIEDNIVNTKIRADFGIFYVTNYDYETR